MPPVHPDENEETEENKKKKVVLQCDRCKRHLEEGDAEQVGNQFLCSACAMVVSGNNQ